jgi:predicted aspartyl protease
MIRGIVNSDRVPEISLSVAGRSWPTLVDTGFNGDLELPEALRPFVNARYTTDIVSLLAGGQELSEPAFDVDFPFDGHVVVAETTFVGNDGILLGTNMLRDYRLTVDFVARTGPDRAGRGPRSLTASQIP